MKDAAQEIEKIVMSKKTLLEDWQKSLFGMQQRDKALQALRELIKQKDDEILQLKSEITGVKNETKKEQETSERLHERQDKYRSEEEFLLNKKGEIEAEMKRLSEQLMMLKGSLMATEDQSKKMDMEKSEVDVKMTTLEKSIMNLHTKTKSLRDDIINHAS